MLARGTIEKTIGSQPGCEVRAVGDGARFAGDLCEPEDNSTISQNRTSLGGRSLLVYNRQYRVRSELLKSANPATLAVGMRKRDGTVLDYPPQLLEPVWKLANLRSGSLSGSGMQHKCSPTKWLRHIKEVARQVRETVQFPKITLCEEMFDPEFLDAKIPNFKAGPIAEAVKIQPLYPQTIPTAEILDVFKSLKTERERDRRMKTAKWEWLDPMTYDPRASPAKIRTELESKLADVPRGALVLAALPDSRLQEHHNREQGGNNPKPDLWLLIKNAAGTGAKQPLRSQCFYFSGKGGMKSWLQQQILCSIDAKCGGQLKLFAEHQRFAALGTYFVALDLSRNQGPQGISVGCCTAVLGSDGRVLYLPADHHFQRGETMTERFLIDTISYGLEQAIITFGQAIRRIVVSRDGRYQRNEIDALHHMAEQYNCKLDLVEVTKSGPEFMRIMQFKGTAESAANPESGKYCLLNNMTALLTTTGADTYKLPTGMVQPIIITLVEGTTPMRQVVDEQYGLSRLCLYTSKPTRLPCHLHLADRAALDHLKGLQYPKINGLHAA